MNRIALSNALALVLALGLADARPGSAAASDAEPAPTATVTAIGTEIATAPAPAPAWFDEVAEGGASPIGDRLDDPDGRILAKGRRSYSEQRARLDARSLLEAAVSEWLAPEIPEGWALPEPLVDALIVDQHVEPVLLDLDRLDLALDEGAPDLPRVLYVAAIRADASADRREAFLDAYQREVGARRLAWLGGLGGFALSCLAILALYIRADEATRGYYTGRLRVVAVASALGAGAVIARLVA